MMPVTMLFPIFLLICFVAFMTFFGVICTKSSFPVMACTTKLPVGVGGHCYLYGTSLHLKQRWMTRITCVSFFSMLISFKSNLSLAATCPGYCFICRIAKSVDVIEDRMNKRETVKTTFFIIFSTSKMHLNFQIGLWKIFKIDCNGNSESLFKKGRHSKTFLAENRGGRKS